MSLHTFFAPAMVLLCTPLTLAETIPVQNAGFEFPALAECQFNSSIQGWTTSGGGVWRILPCWDHEYPAGGPQGVQVGYSNSGDIWQTLTTTLQPFKTYTLTVMVGRRATCCPMQDYAVQLRANGAILAQDAGTLEPAPGTFEQSTVSFTTGEAHPQLGHPLEIRLVRVGGGQANFDDVLLTAVSADCNSNGVSDSVDIKNGTSLDVNGNGVPDECEPACPEDFVPPGGDGTINVDDLLGVISAWGPCGSGPCPADIAPIGGDSQVNVDDLLAVISAWGQCE